MWLRVPSTCCPSPPESGGSISAFVWRSPLLASSALSKSKRMPLKFWQKGWKTVGWMTRLYGRIYEPSTAALGAESWISSLRAIRVSPSATQVAASAPTTPDTSGPMSLESSKSVEQLSFSWRTSTGTCPWGSMWSAESFNHWVTELKRDSSMRLKRALLIYGSDCSLWPTPTAMDSIGSGAAGYSTDSGRHTGLTLTDAVRLWKLWEKEGHQGTGEFAPSRLLELARAGQVGKGGWLNEWIVNPRFSEALMGLPPAWTDLEPVETASCPSKPLEPSSS